MDPRLVERYQSAAGAAGYRRKYERSWMRRLSHRREMALVHRALTRLGPLERVLDCPCGAGRLVPTILRHAEHVTGVDLSAAMVLEATDALAAMIEAERVDLQVAGADDLPFDDGRFDATVCHRLIHHVPEASERAAVLAELARVTRDHLLLSFSDATSFKARSQARRGRTRRRHVIAPDDLAAEAAPHGLVMVGRPRRLAGLVSVVAVATFRREGP